MSYPAMAAGLCLLTMSAGTIQRRAGATEAKAPIVGARKADTKKKKPRPRR